VNLVSFRILQNKIGTAHAELPNVVMQLIKDVATEWPRFEQNLATVPTIRRAVNDSIKARSVSLAVDAEIQ
jgi:hypothetical protein